jgi:tyrosyl-tRNA synthetase
MNNKNKKTSVKSGIWFNMTTPLQSMTRLGYSKSEIKRLIKNGAVEKNGHVVTDSDWILEEGDTLRIGKKRFLTI